MKERPILFSAPMVRAILSGTKTQTRRLLPAVFNSPPDLVVAANQPGDWNGPFKKSADSWGIHFGGQWGTSLRCPYGLPGDRLWVRETWGLHRFGDFTCWHRDSIAGRSEDDLRLSWDLAYAADAESPYDHWRPSIHMPRWASRIALDVTEVRVERLQAITPSDAIAEGVFGDGRYATAPPLPYPVATFADLWDSINGARASWASNPWVWVVSFKRAGSAKAAA